MSSKTAVNSLGDIGLGAWPSNLSSFFFLFYFGCTIGVNIFRNYDILKFDSLILQAIPDAFVLYRIECLIIIDETTVEWYIVFLSLFKYLPNNLYVIQCRVPCPESSLFPWLINYRRVFLLFDEE